MFPISINDLSITMVICLFIIGLISVGLGVYILISKVLGDEVKVLAKQIAKLAQKGLADDVFGLVGNASSLIDSLNQLVLTTSGIGVFLVILGCVFMGASYFMLLQVI
ncbi:MAG: hypothetical protein HPY76_14945 [Anaerolineae bacterium]|jgi:hypothetical protein|nr:hypothetical protein [Anaerolineae bacterium]